MTMHVVQYSGGIGSWAATQRVIAAHGTANLVLLVADTRVEDPDLWRFVHDSTVHIGVKPTIVSDGRTPFEVFRDQRFLGNSRLAPCSAILKQRPSRAWLKQHADPADTVLYVGTTPATGRHGTSRPAPSPSSSAGSAAGRAPNVVGSKPSWAGCGRSSRASTPPPAAHRR